MASATFNYKSFVKDKLKPHAFGLTIDELEEKLPHNGDVTELHSTLEKLDDKDKIRKVGDKWQWAKF